MKKYEQPNVEIIIFDEFVATLDVGTSAETPEPYNLLNGLSSDEENLN